MAPRQKMNTWRTPLYDSQNKHVLKVIRVFIYLVTCLSETKNESECTCCFHPYCDGRLPGAVTRETIGTRVLSGTGGVNSGRVHSRRNVAVATFLWRIANVAS